MPNWRQHIEAGRERWRLIQTAAAVGDASERAAEALRALGYTITAPDPVPAAAMKALHNW
jgi:hypothetical protein